MDIIPTTSIRYYIHQISEISVKPLVEITRTGNFMLMPRIIGDRKTQKHINTQHRLR